MKQKIKLLGLFSALAVSSAQAEIALNGFANIVGGQTTSSDESLYDYGNNLDFNTGSLLALQASSDLGEGFGVTAQILARGNNEWQPEFEWAYVSYDATDELRFLAGRQRVPFYMYSDYLDVSYAYPWITPPEGVYSVPFDSFDGLGAIYSTSLGSFDSTLQVIYGGYKGEAGGVDVDFQDLMGLSFTVNRDWLTLRAGYIRTNMNIDDLDEPKVDAAYAGWVGAGFPEIASHLEVKDDLGDFIELGFQVDYENFLLIGEYTQLTLENVPLANSDNMYVMAGYRFNNLLAHITYGINDAAKDAITGSAPPVPTGSADFDELITGTDEYVADLEKDTAYYTVGLRWDFHDSAALKFEYTSFADNLDSTQDAGLFRTAIVTVF